MSTVTPIKPKDRKRIKKQSLAGRGLLRFDDKFRAEYTAIVGIEIGQLWQVSSILNLAIEALQARDPRGRDGPRVQAALQAADDKLRYSIEGLATFCIADMTEQRGPAAEVQHAS